MQCVSCGEEIPTGSEFCNRCGAQQVDEENGAQELDVSLYNIVMAGLVGAGVLVVFETIFGWVAGWTSDPRYSGYEWFTWMALSILGLGTVSIVAGISVSLGRLYDAGRVREWLFWSVASPLTLGLAFAAAVGAGVD
jgi:predicted nucleic acid-binding Zn ribbon protein